MARWSGLWRRSGPRCRSRSRRRRIWIVAVRRVRVTWMARWSGLWRRSGPRCRSRSRRRRIGVVAVGRVWIARMRSRGVRRGLGRPPGGSRGRGIGRCVRNRGRTRRWAGIVAIRRVRPARVPGRLGCRRTRRWAGVVAIRRVRPARVPGRRGCLCHSFRGREKHDDQAEYDKADRHRQPASPWVVHTHESLLVRANAPLTP